VEQVSTPGRRAGGRQIIPRPSVWAADVVPPWSPRPTWSVEELVGVVPPRSAPLLPAFPDARVSAVLVVLAPGAQGPEVLLTKRSMAMRNHRGEISFPGGRVDPGETPVEAALREADEEVGLDPTTPTVVGELTHLNTVVSNSYIVPVVATLPGPVELSARTGEVDRVLWTSVEELTRPGTYHVETWGTPPVERSLHFFDLDDETIWGATAHILVDLLTR
jgi:8-oxo-dGTP pyrophosphatase MutT (NUDIX family)